MANIFATYEMASGQKINADESSLFVSPNILEGDKQRLMSTLGINSVMQQEQYLGLPLFLGRSKTCFFGGKFRDGRGDFY